MVEPYATVGGAAAALLFHTLQIYIFTTATEWPTSNVFTHQLGAVVKVVWRTHTDTRTHTKGNKSLTNKPSEMRMCYLYPVWSTLEELCKTGCSRMTANVNLPKNDRKKLRGTTPCCLGKSVKERRSKWERSRSFVALPLWTNRCQLSVFLYSIHAGLKEGVSNQGTDIRQIKGAGRSQQKAPSYQVCVFF